MGVPGRLLLLLLQHPLGLLLATTTKIYSSYQFRPAETSLTCSMSKWPLDEVS